MDPDPACSSASMPTNNPAKTAAGDAKRSDEHPRHPSAGIIGAAFGHVQRLGQLVSQLC